MILLSNDYRAYGEKVYLRPITIEDTDMLLRWRNSPYVVNNFFYRLPISREEHINWMNNKVATGQVYQFIVCLISNDMPVGCVYLQHYDASDNSMESGVFMSEDTPKGQGIGTEAVRLMNEEVAFGILKLNRTVARVIATNAASLRLHEKAGFWEESRCDEKTVPDGEIVSAVTFGLNNVR